jgi:hypothetical protein
MECKDVFLAGGGETFHYIPCPTTGQMDCRLADVQSATQAAGRQTQEKRSEFSITNDRTSKKIRRADSSLHLVLPFIIKVGAEDGDTTSPQLTNTPRNGRDVLKSG